MEKEKNKALIVLYKAQHALYNLAKKDVKKYGLTIAEFSVLEVLYHKDKLTVAKLSQTILMPNSSLTYILNKLSKANLINREIKSEDKRVTFVSLSSEGLRRMDYIMPRHNKLLKEVFNQITLEQQLSLIESLKIIGNYAAGLGGIKNGK